MESAESLSLDFQKTWLILKRRWLPAAGIFSSVVAIAAVLTCFQKPVYETKGKILLKKVDQTSALTGLGEKIGELNAVNIIKSDPLKTESQVIDSIPLIQKTITDLNLKDKRGEMVKPETLAKQVKVKPIVETDVLEISYQSNDPKEAAAIVNKLANVYIENNVLVNRAEAAAAGKFIAEQIPESDATVRQAELALSRFKEQNHIVSLDQESKAAVDVIKELEIKIKETQAALADVSVRSTNLQKQLGVNSQQGIAMNSLNQSHGVQNVLEEFQQVENQLAVQRTRFQEEHPTIVNLKIKEAALKTLLQGRVEQAVRSVQQVASGNLQSGESKQRLTEDLVKTEVERLGLVSRLANLSNAQASYKQRLNILPKLEGQQRALQRQLEAAQATYEILLKKLQEVRVAENQNIGNARVIEPASVPETASIRKTIMILGLGCVLGILLSGATVFALEVTDISIKTLKEARDMFGYTVVGVIPSLKKKATPRGRGTESTVPELPVRDTPRSPICEAYRMLQANLKFLSSDKPLQVIVVKSSIPKEGKSKVSANLAATMAQLGRRVLLVDADMRRPSQHHIWALTNAAGLSDVIVGQAEFQAAVAQVMPFLDVLTSGVIPPNPLALLDSKRMASLIENFSQIYDFVIIDAPPLVVAADALTLGKMADGVLLVARPGTLDSTSAVVSKESLERSGQNVLGLVVNGVNPENEFYTKEYSSEEDSTTRASAISNS